MANRTSEPSSKPPGGAIRTCVACREEGDKRALIRVVRGLDGLARLDPTGRAPGRGAYLHRDQGCIENARRKRALERSLRATVAADFWTQLSS